MRKLAVGAGSFAAGAFLAQYLLPQEWRLRSCLAILMLGCLGFLLRDLPRLRVLLIAGGVASALAYSWLYTTVVQVPAELLAGTETASLSMTLCDYAEATQYGAKVTVLLQVDGTRPMKAVYYGEDSLLDLKPGSMVTNDLELKSAAKIRDDNITAFTAKGVFLLAYGRGEEQTAPGNTTSPRWWPIRAGHAMQTRIAELFSGDSAAFLKAILTGDRSGFSTGAASDLSEVGLSHILAVSGMHCAFLLSMVQLLTGKRRHRSVAVIAIPLLLFYALLTGCSPSVIRACVMLILLLLAPLFRRENDPPTAMAAALALILIQNPFAAASVSLQLSFAAVAGILWLTPKLSAALLHGKQRNPVTQFLIAGVSTTLGASLFTIPLTAFYFNILVLVAPLSNLLCLWAAGVIFCLGLLAVWGSFLWMPLGTGLGMIPKVLIDYLLSVTHLLGKLPYHAVYFSNPYLKYWLGFLYVLFGLAYLQKPDTRRKYALSTVLALLTLGVTVWLGAQRDTAGTLNITVLDVGQGESVVLESGGAYVLIDCGSGNSWYDAGVIAADRLQSMGCGKLNYLMLTHYDYDHVSGVEDLMARLPVDTLLLPDVQDDSGMRAMVLRTANACDVRVLFVTEKKCCALGNASLTVYPPLGTTGDNERGLTALCTSGTYDLLVTGDMDSRTERELVQEDALPDIEAMIVGHHGSKNATSEELLKAVTPEIGIISVGSNSYGHPSDQTLRRLLRAGVTIYRTDLQGDIHLTVN